MEAARSYRAGMDPVQRAHITRELHDVVAHSISVVTVQAAAAATYLERDPAQAREHLKAVCRTAHDALADMRRLSGLAPAGEAVRLPQPTLGRLHELVAEARAVGVQVRLVEQGVAREIPPGVGLAVYRIVQEAVANVLRHAGAASATGACVAPHEIEIEVTNQSATLWRAPGRGDGIRGCPTARRCSAARWTPASSPAGCLRCGRGYPSSCQNPGGPRGTGRGTRRELRAALAGELRQHRVHRLLLGHAGVERLLAAEPGCDLQRLAAVVAERREDGDEEVAVRDRLADLERRMPRREHRQVVLVEVGDRLGVMRVRSCSGISSTHARTTSPSSCRRASRPTDSAMTRIASWGSMKQSGIAGSRCWI